MSFQTDRSGHIPRPSGIMLTNTGPVVSNPTFKVPLGLFLQTQFSLMTILEGSTLYCGELKSYFKYSDVGVKAGVKRLD